HRRVRPIFTAPADDPVISAHEVGPPTDLNAIILTRHRLYRVRPSGETMFSIPLEMDRNHYEFSAAVLPANKHLVLWIGPVWPELKDVYPQQIVELADDGRVVRRTEPRWEAESGELQSVRAALLGVVCP